MAEKNLYFLYVKIFQNSLNFFYKVIYYFKIDELFKNRNKIYFIINKLR